MRIRNVEEAALKRLSRDHQLVRDEALVPELIRFSRRTFRTWADYTDLISYSRRSELDYLQNRVLVLNPVRSHPVWYRRNPVRQGNYGYPKFY